MTVVACFYVDFGNSLYPALAYEMFTSARKHLPECKTMMITDSSTPGFNNVDKVVRAGGQIPRDRLMPYRVSMTARLAAAVEDTVVFVDPDVVFVNCLPVLSENFDVAVTVRADAALYSMPINTGVMISKPTAAARNFWSEVEKIALSLRPSELHEWWGDQIAMALAVGAGAIHMRDADVIQVGQAQVRLLPEYEYNAPAERDNLPAEARIVHYKGDRKASS